MSEYTITPHADVWNSNDLLVRVHDGEKLESPSPSDKQNDLSQSYPLLTMRDSSASDLSFDAPSLAAIECDQDRFESLSVLRSRKPSGRHLLGFAARNKSTWALDVLVNRYTRGGYDWSSLRAVAINFSNSPRNFDPVLDQIKLDSLWGICEALHARGMDLEAEKSLLRFIAIRVAEGREFDSAAVESLMENLLNLNLGDEARELLPLLKNDSWVRHAITVDLTHPRFGGSNDVMLAILNQAYRRFGLETVSLDAEGPTPFERLNAVGTSELPDGPLVSIIMSCWSPGTEILAAVRSIICQTYQNWELLVTDDASSSQFEDVLCQVEALDPRIRVIRNADNVGTYVRRNEAIDLARGELVTVQDSDDWSHPRRLEIQVRELVSKPDSYANVIRAARATDQFSIVSPRGAKLFISEPSILFHREAVLDAIGYFDTTRKGADTEFRQRLEVATGVPVRIVGPEIPLEFMLADTASLSGGDFGKSLWTAPTRLAYRSSTRRYHDQIRSGTRTAKIAFPQERRLIHAPGRLLGIAPMAQRFDLLLVADGHGVRHRADFIRTLVGEIRIAISAGLKVALLHSDSTTGVQNAGPLARPLQALIDSGRLHRVFEDDTVETTLAVIRHAGAAQGHISRRLAVQTERVLVIEDLSAGDKRGVTVAKADVLNTVKAWLDVSPEWVLAQSGLPTPELVSGVVSGDGTELRLAIRRQSPDQIVQAALLGHQATTTTTQLDEDGLIHAVFELADVEPGDFEIAIVVDTETGKVVQHVETESRSVVTMRSSRVLVPREDGGLSLLPSNYDVGEGTLSSEAFASRFLDTSICTASIFRDNLELTIVSGAESSLRNVYAFREVDGNIRRREFKCDELDDRTVRAGIPIQSILDVRWKVFGSFDTCFGTVHAPLEFPDDMRVENTSAYRIRQLTDDGSGVLHVVQRNLLSSRSAATPLLSVVMPVYNVASYLDTAIRSVLTQNLTDLELIIVDDASSDNSRRIIEMHRDLDERVRVFELDHNTLGGAGIPSNLGIKAARGKYLAFVDSDDWATNGIFAKLIASAEEHDAEVVIGDFRTFSDSHRSIVDAYDASAWRDIPLGEVISAYTHPSLLRLSAVPWRKLYRRDLLTQNNILYPEGDYFYEDNPLHWFVLSRADRVIATDEIVSYHRMEREGQTMGASQYKLGAVVSHANTICNYLSATEHSGREVLFTEFFAYLERLKWTVKRQTQAPAAKLIQSRIASIYDRAIRESPNSQVTSEARELFESYNYSYPDLDLTIVIPVYNSEDLLPGTVDSVLGLEGLNYNVLVVDDGSNDKSYKLMKEYEDKYENIYVFKQKNSGAGRARNSVIPLITGRYSYFLDSDDTVDATALKSAVTKADEVDSDLLFVKYGIDYIDEGRAQGMFKSDALIWEELERATTHAERQKLAAGLINYPWNRLIRTSLLHDANIFFGPTVVHNDVLFHWHSILASTNIDILPVETCVHRKFKTRAQVTNIADGRRMAVTEALRGTHQSISVLDTYPLLRGEWRKFALDLLEWASGRIPTDLQKEYAARREEIGKLLASD